MGTPFVVRRPGDPGPNPRALLVASFLALGANLPTLPAFGASGVYPSLETFALTSERIELVRVTAPQDTSQAPVFVGGRMVHYQVISPVLGSGRSPGSVTVHVLAHSFVPLVGDTLLVFWGQPSE